MLILINISKDGSTNNETVNARKIIMEVRIPKVENSGIGAKPMIANPKILDAAEANKAIPVPFIDLNKASVIVGLFLISSLNLIVICIEKSTPTPNEIAPMVAVT